MVSIPYPHHFVSDRFGRPVVFALQGPCAILAQVQMIYRMGETESIPA
jgi:hypothetical protein